MQRKAGPEDALTFLSPVGVNDLRHRFDHVLHVLVGHFRVQRERNDALIFTIGYREIIRLETVLITIVGVEVNGDKVNAGANAACFEFFNELIARDPKTFQAQAYHLKMPGMFHLTSFSQCG